MSGQLFRAHAVSAYRRGHVHRSTLRYSSPLARWSGVLLAITLVVGTALATVVRVPAYVIGDGVVVPGPAGDQAVVAFPAGLPGAPRRGSEVELRAEASDPIAVTLVEVADGLTTAQVVQRFDFSPAGDPGAGAWLVGVAPLNATVVPALVGQRVQARATIGTRPVTAVFDGRGVVVWRP